ncbi:MAG: RluA family pseudouridine synthase [Myxococcota bacterium]
MNDPFRVVFQDADLIIVDKAPTIATTAPKGGDSLTQRLAQHLGATASAMLHATSRLDRPVSGLVTYALSKRAELALREGRAAGRYTRVYVGLSAVPADGDEGEWNVPIGIDPKKRKLRSVHGKERRQDARTRYRNHGAHTLELRPITGRTHQLRVHAAHAGRPLLGDRDYGGERRVVSTDGRITSAERVMLHCAFLRLPIGGGLEVRAPLPEDFRACHAALTEENDTLSFLQEI